MEVRERIGAAGKNTLLQEADIWFNNARGERVSGVYSVMVEFDPERKQIIGERMYSDPVFGQMWLENLGDDFINVPGVSRITPRP
jgi:hypothetical protein